MPESTSHHIDFADADAGWETIPIPSDCECMPNAGVAVGSPDADRETIPTSSDCERVPGSGIGSDAGDSFILCGVTVTMVFWSRSICSRTGAGCDVPESSSRRISFTNADVGWKTMPIPPDCERVPKAGVVVGGPNAVRETMPFPLDCKRVPYSGVTAGATHAGWETMSIPPGR